MAEMAEVDYRWLLRDCLYVVLMQILQSYDKDKFRRYNTFPHSPGVYIATFKEYTAIISCELKLIVRRCMVAAAFLICHPTL